MPPTIAGHKTDSSSNEGRFRELIDAIRENATWASIGYGLWWTVLFSNGLNGPSWLPLLQSDAAFAQTIRIVLYVPYAAMFFIALAARKHLAPLCGRRSLLIAASTASSVGLVLMGLSGFALIPSFFMYAGVVLFSIGTMVPILGFSELFCLFGAKKACINVCLSLAISAPMFFGIAWLGQTAFPLALASEVACPLLALPLLFGAWNKLELRADHESVERGPIKMPPGLMAAMFVYGAAFGLVLGLGAQSTAPGFAELVANAAFVCALSLGVLLLVCLTKPFTIGRVYRPVLPLIALGFILFSMLGAGGSTVSMGIVLAGYACSRIFAVTICADITMRAPTSALASASLGCLADAGGVAVGSACAQTLLVGMGIESDRAYDVSMIIVGALIVVTVFLLSESRIETLWGILPARSSDELNHAPQHSLPDCSHAARAFGLTPREAEVLEHLVRGESAPDIADSLTVSKSTVLTHTKRIYAKLHVHSRVELLNVVMRASDEAKN